RRRPVSDRFRSLLLVFGLPHRHGRTGGVGDDAHRAVVGHLHDVHHHLGAQVLGLAGGGVDVVHTDVRQPVGRRAGRLVDHHAAAGAATHVDHGVRTTTGHGHVLQLP